MEIVWKDNVGRWYHAKYKILNGEVSGKKQIYNIKDVEHIDEYIHMSKEKYLAKFNITTIQENIGVPNFYIKDDGGYKSKNEHICKSCTKICKSDLVIDCNYYNGPNGGDSWRV